MSKICHDCQNQNINVSMPYAAHEAEMTLIERFNKRLWILIIVLIIALVGTNLAWVIYENSFEDCVITQEVEQDADNGTNNFVGGNVYGETENQNNN